MLWRSCGLRSSSRCKNLARWCLMRISRTTSLMLRASPSTLESLCPVCFPASVPINSPACPCHSIAGGVLPPGTWLDWGAVSAGIAVSNDPVLQTRVLAYADTQRYRLGVNYQLLPVSLLTGTCMVFHRYVNMSHSALWKSVFIAVSSPARVL